MYAGSGFESSELGDVDVIKAGDTYHLFHLVLPNHDYIAHAVSEDGFTWRRVKNALFIGDPGAWDDDMLWTMHVTPDPENAGAWRMFYTGLSRREEGRVQRIGLARSRDLYTWEKDTGGSYPLRASGYYEADLSEGRHWVSFRDPFFFIEGDNRLLLANARVSSGPVIRRGCVALMRETEPNRFEFLRPLFHPFMYDDVEVPGLYHIGDQYYLLGSLREDIKVHYWHSENLRGPYSAFYDNLLLPQGNYAGRIRREDDGSWLIWNFFANWVEPDANRLLPPPKEVVVIEGGRLALKSFRGFDAKVDRVCTIKELCPLRPLFENATARFQEEERAFAIASESGYEIFLFEPRCIDFRLRFSVRMEGRGKAGIVFRADEEGNGYFISLDMVNGIAQARAWGHRPGGRFNEAFLYKNIQQNHFFANASRAYDLEAVAYGGYIEFSVNGFVILSLVDTTYMEQDRLGLYVESAAERFDDVQLEVLKGPSHEDYGPL